MVKIGHASIDERGKIKGGRAGDQTGKEVCVRDWYNKPWTHVIRFKDKNMQKRNAECMLKACENQHIGYDQLSRNGLLMYAANVNYDPSKVTAICNTDCSALVSLCCMYAGVPQSVLYQYGNSSTTGNIRRRLQDTGLVDVFYDSSYTTKPDKLMVGDILLAEGKHVAIVVANDPSNKSIEDVAREVLDGKWGTGEERRSRLISAGYDYKAVQAEVNFLLGNRL